MAYDLIARLRLIDNMSGPLRNATRGISGLGGVARGSSFSLGRLAAAMTGVGAAAGAIAVVGSSLNKAMKFEAQIDAIASLDSSLKKGTKGYADMQALALKLGASTKYSALEAAQGMEQLVKAGMPMKTMLNGGAEAALNLAAAGGVEVAKAAEVMAVAMNAFKRDNMTAAQAADILAGTANAAATGVDDLRYGISSVGAVAAGLGLTFRDTASAIGIMTNNGLQAQDAGTSLKAMFGNLTPTTKTQIALFRRLGLTTKDNANRFYDTAGNIKTMDQIAQLLQDSLKGLNREARSNALRTMFGDDGVRAGLMMFEEGAKGVKAFQQQMANTTALKMARDRMDNATGAVEQFKGAIETLQISALMPTLPIIKDLALAASDFITKYSPRITAAVQKAVDFAKNYVGTHFINNPDFQKLPDLKSKILFVWEDIWASFNNWMDGGGRDNISRIATNIIDFLAQSLKASQPLIEAAVKIGAALGKGILDGLMNFAKEHPEIAALVAGMSTPGPIQVKIAAAGVAAVTPQFADLPAKLKADSDRLKGYQQRDGTVLGTINEWADRTIRNLHIDWNGSSKAERDKAYQQSKAARGHAGGLDRVPYNGYQARLHKDEMVLTPERAAEYKKGSGGHSFAFGDIHINGASGNVEEMADQLMKVIARRVQEAGAQM